MLDPTFVRENLEAVRTGLRNRGMDPDQALEQIATLEGLRRRVKVAGAVIDQSDHRRSMPDRRPASNPQAVPDPRPGGAGNAGPLVPGCSCDR